MTKVMLFIDGTWLYANTDKLSEAYGTPNYRVDFGKLPHVLAQQVANSLGVAEVDIVRTYLFGSYPANYDVADEQAVEARLGFFKMLREEYHYEVEMFPVNFKGRRLRRLDRDPSDSFEPKEKCVDVALATTMLYLATVPYAYDIGIAVVGDGDFTPMLRSVRRLGKRVAIASIKGSCAPEFADPRDEARVKDFDIIWLNDFLQELELKFERHQIRCQSPIHKGDRLVWTTFHPRKGEKFFCDDCRAEYARQKALAQREVVSNEIDPDTSGAEEVSLAKRLTGKISNLVSDRGYGFIRTADGHNWFFHLTDLVPPLEFNKLRKGDSVEFRIKKMPSGSKAGAAESVQRPDQGTAPPTDDACSETK